MMDYVTDTHSLVWHFTEDRQLSENALAAFEETIEVGSIIVPTIVLAEVMYICQKGRVSLTFSETLVRLEEDDGKEIREAYQQYRKKGMNVLYSYNS